MAPASSSSSSSTTTSPSSSASSKPVDVTHKSDPRTLIVAVILSIAAAFLVGYIIYLTLRLKRRQSSRDSSSGPYHGSPADRNHPASHISPFASASTHPGGVVPRFQHTPGSDMRIAVRRPDGAWHFADSRTPFTPSGVSDIDVLPSPSPSSSTSFFPWSSRTNLSQKEIEVRKGYGRDFDADVTFPPPAYSHSNDSASSIDQHTDR